MITNASSTALPELQIHDNTGVRGVRADTRLLAAGVVLLRARRGLDSSKPAGACLGSADGWMWSPYGGKTTKGYGGGSNL